MSRRLQLLIDQVRRETENEEVSDNTGIQDSEFIQYFNDAQHRVQAKITAQHPTVFVTEESQNTVIDQEAYDLPADIYLDNKISMVEYSDTGFDADFFTLESRTIRSRDTTFSGNPNFYIRRSGQILLVPKPQSAGTLRIQYTRQIAEVDLRRGIISAVTTDSTQLTALTLDTAGTPIPDTTDLAEHDFLCIIGKDGTTKMKNIEFDSIDSSTGIVTLTANHTFATGETAAIGDYIVGGQNTSSHSQLPRSIERYLIAYCTWKILKRDSSADYQEQQAELLSMEQDIIDSYADITDDIIYIPDFGEWD